ncbi:MAG TPA: hypothetical protein VFP80_04015 [Thermoanaerobaculia bacterium]|nr:hypothetical protein [Thermoanaerobaculia bacterium]
MKFVLALVSVAVVVLHLTSLPITIWEYDENLFAKGVERYEPLKHFPPPPGAPLFIGTGKVVAPLFGGDAFRTLIGMNAFLTVAGFALLALAFRAIAGSARAGILGAALFYAMPAMLVHGTLALADAGALALLALSLWLGARRSPLWFGIACAATVGWRPQFAIAVVPLLFVTVALMRTWRERLIAIGSFGAACLAWLVPLMASTGGVLGFWKWLSGQAAYFAEHDADVSRSGRTVAQIGMRFVAHPWGPKWLAAPVLLLAALGLVTAARRRMGNVLPAVAMTVVYLAFAMWMMDPADGARYALPAHPGIALLAILGMESLRGVSRAGWVLVGAYAAGAYLYAAPILRQRTALPSPPVAAIRYLRSVAPRNALVLYDLPLKPHVQNLLRDFTCMRVDEGLLRFGNRVDLPIFELTDSAVTGPGGKVFRWETPDAYSKLTRNHYGAVSVLPMPAERRFLAVEGIWPPERKGAQTWRWLGAKSTIALPDLGADRVRLTFAVPEDYPLASNGISVAVEGGASGGAIVARGRETVLELPLPHGAARLHIAPAQTFVPSGLNRDRRRLSVMLTGLEQVRIAASRSTRAASSVRGRS